MKKKQKTPNPRWKDDVLNPGFTILPNTLIDRQCELGITDVELLLILKVSRNSPDWHIHDNDIPGNMSPRTLQRTRRSLRQKGYLDFTVFRRVNDTDDGKQYYTSGITYNFAGLECKLLELPKVTYGAGEGNQIADESNKSTDGKHFFAHQMTNLSRGEHPMDRHPNTNPSNTNPSNTNIPYIIIIYDNNNKKIKVKLCKEQGLFLEEFKDKYKETYGTEFHPQMKDVKVLQKQNIKELLENVYLLSYWFPWKDDLFQMNEWLKKSDGSLPVFFKPDINHKFRSEFIPRVWHDRHDDSTIAELFGKHMENYIKFKRRA